MSSLVEILAPTVSADGTHTSFTPTYTTSASVGDLVVVAAMTSGSGTQTAITDSAGNTYGNGHTTRDTAASFRVYLWATTVTSAITGGVSTLTTHISGSTWHVVAASKVVGGQGALDKQGASTGQSTATPLTGTSGALAATTDLAIAVYGWNGTASFTEPASYTNPHGAGVVLNAATPGVRSAVTYRQLAASTAVNPSATLGASSASGGMVDAYLAPAAGGVVSSPGLMMMGVG